MIFTFYSYKGGVGRSMALANVAELFYQVGLKVLMVDWDLEAPGLERFFPIDADDILGKPGVIDLLLDYKQQMSQDMLNLKGGDKLPFQRPTELMTNIYPNASEKGKLYLLTAGKRANKHFEKYANTVLTFDWQDFYQNWEGGLYFDWLRQQFEEVADVILIDSRTGITEMGGICTYHLADVIVMFCTPSQQCMNGTYKMAQNFISSKVKKLRGERRLDILVIPARIERAESSLMDNFQQEFLNKFKTFIPNKKLTENIDDIAQKLWETLRIPYVPKYAYNEILAVREGELDSAIDISEAFLNLKQEMIRLRIYQLAEMLVELNFQKHKSELKYLASSLESLATRLPEFDQLYSYASSMIVAYDNPGKAADKLLKAFGDNPINIEGVILPVPKQVLKNGKKFHFFVYPNVKLSQQQFIGCGRYIANDTSLGENFKPATLGIGGKIEELYIIASILAPESSEMGKRIYEIQDIPGIIYRGKSQNFAYLLVLISRSRKIKLEGIHGDIWCTGSIRLLEGKNPILETIDPTVFGINLEAFLSKENHDKLFIIPSSALLPSHYQILREMGKYLNIVSLTQFQKLSTQEFAERKTILKVFENELEVLINIIFHPPQHYKNQGKIVKNDLSISKIPISEKSEILSSELWQPYLAGTPVTAADIPKQEHTFQLDDGHVLIRCYWEGQRGREQGYLWLSWAVAISKKKTLCILFFNPETMEVRHQVQLGTFLDGEEIFTFAELGFDPVQEKWAISCRLDSIDGGGKR